LGQKPEIVTGHDFSRLFGLGKKLADRGSVAAGCKVHDIGLAMTPMAYFAQFELDVPCVAMVTASHNDNGWDRREDGRQPSDDVWARRDDAAEGTSC
jgi:phosphomannomutase/phosphoglucomutase